MPGSTRGAPGRDEEARPTGRPEGDRGSGESLQALGNMVDNSYMEERADDLSFGPKTRQKAVKEAYWAQSSKYHYLILGMVRHVLVSLRGTNRLTVKPHTSYELSALLYDTILDGCPTYVYQDIDAEHSGTSKLENINVAYAVFEVLDLTMRKLEGDHFPKSRSIGNQTGIKGNPITSPTDTASATAVGSTGSPHNASSNVGTTITWYYCVSPSPSKSQHNDREVRFNRDTATLEPKRIRLASMSEVISVIVPLLLANPRVVQHMTYFTEFGAYSGLSDKVSLYEPVRYRASFCLSTREYRAAWWEQSSSSVSQLSRAILARDGLSLYKAVEPVPVRRQTSEIGLPTLEARLSSQASTAMTEKSKTVQKHQEKFKRDMRRMDGWVVEENGVRVRCGRYVLTTMASAAFLVLGGISAGLTIKDHLNPVDPFNITMFCWVVAAFVVLVAKSLLVAEWPWRDFLQRQVLCRSVSELHSVTGIEDQLILASLIQGESDNCLQTRGP